MEHLLSVNQQYEGCNKDFKTGWNLGSSECRTAVSSLQDWAGCQRFAVCYSIKNGKHTTVVFQDAAKSSWITHKMGPTT